MATGVLPMEIAVYAVPAVTLLLGILIGYLAQLPVSARSEGSATISSSATRGSSQGTWP